MNLIIKNKNSQPFTFALRIYIYNFVWIKRKKNLQQPQTFIWLIIAHLLSLSPMIDYHTDSVRGSFKITGKIVSDGSDVKWDLKNVVIGGNQIPRKKTVAEVWLS